MIDNKTPAAVAMGNTLRKVKNPRVGIASEYTIVHKNVVNNQAKPFRTNIFTPLKRFIQYITYTMLKTAEIDHCYSHSSAHFQKNSSVFIVYYFSSFL